MVKKTTKVAPKGAKRKPEWVPLKGLMVEQEIPKPTKSTYNYVAIGMTFDGNSKTARGYSIASAVAALNDLVEGEVDTAPIPSSVRVFKLDDGEGLSLAV